MKDNIIDFKERLEEDEAFREIFANAANLDEVVDMAREYGYNFDVDEILGNVELSDELLEAAAGGANSDYMHTMIDDNDFLRTTYNNEDMGKT